MIELTEQQVLALGAAGSGPLRVVNPQTKEAFVLLRVDEYERLKADDYDESPWTREELEALAWESAGSGVPRCPPPGGHLGRCVDRRKLSRAGSRPATGVGTKHSSTGRGDVPERTEENTLTSGDFR